MEIINSISWGVVVCAFGLMGVLWYVANSNHEEPKIASEERVREAIDRFPSIEETIREHLDNGKVLTAKDLNEMIDGCLLYEHNEAIRQRQLSNLNN